MSEVKTKVKEASVAKFLDSIPDDGQRARFARAARADATGDQDRAEDVGDISSASALIITSARAAGKAIGSWQAFRRANRTSRCTCWAAGNRMPSCWAKLGKHSLGKGCLYIKRLDDVNGPLSSVDWPPPVKGAHEDREGRAEEISPKAIRSSHHDPPHAGGQPRHRAGGAAHPPERRG